MLTSHQVLVQELFSNAAKVAELEEQTDKLYKVCSVMYKMPGLAPHSALFSPETHVQVVKQKNEYNFSLSSQLEAKSKEMQQREEDLQTEKANVYQISKELEDERSQKKVRYCAWLFG